MVQVAGAAVSAAHVASAWQILNAMTRPLDSIVLEIYDDVL